MSKLKKHNKKDLIKSDLCEMGSHDWNYTDDKCMSCGKSRLEFEHNEYFKKINYV